MRKRRVHQPQVRPVEKRAPAGGAEHRLPEADGRQQIQGLGPWRDDERDALVSGRERRGEYRIDAFNVLGRAEAKGADDRSGAGIEHRAEAGRRAQRGGGLAGGGELPPCPGVYADRSETALEKGRRQQVARESGRHSFYGISTSRRAGGSTDSAARRSRTASFRAPASASSCRAARAAACA